ncbi:hypothetical protein HPB51_007283 [Rhipicephalus microplus]|uniref:Uncharacterized protein n=1 Tax=Rhipicephalus microplus TaxID=6941 RepID=A0A9J6E7Y9_RHIMP|nr:hypothetical protein HPB51_007283 [Rhipicephalus microplus]
MSNIVERGRPSRRQGTGETRGMACRGGQQRRGSCSPQPAECWIEITELGALPPPATSVREPLFAHIPQEPGTKLVVIGGHVVLESSEPFECVLRAEPNAEPGPSVVAASPRQEQSLVNRNARTAFDSRNETPLRLSGVTRASPRRSATSPAPSAVAAKPTSTLSTPPPPPLLARCVAHARENPGFHRDMRLRKTPADHRFSAEPRSEPQHPNNEPGQPGGQLVFAHRIRSYSLRRRTHERRGR